MARADAAKAESRANYDRANEPAKTYTTSSGKSVSIDPKDKQIERLRTDLDHQKWVNRQQREDAFYGRWTNSPGYHPVFYADPFHSALNAWLLVQTLDTMTLFMYHHQAAMDQQRVAAIYAQNANLQARVAALEAQKVQRDPTWVPAGVDRDLVYDRGYVDAAWNPQPKTTTEYQYEDDSPGLTFSQFLHGVWVFIKWCFYIVLTIAVVCLVLWGLHYILFVYRWGA